jgi:hypothetical protein
MRSGVVITGMSGGEIARIGGLAMVRAVGWGKTSSRLTRGYDAAAGEKGCKRMDEESVEPCHELLCPDPQSCGQVLTADN